MKRMKFRFHRGGLAESMETLVELDANVETLITYLKGKFPEFPFHLEDLRMKSTGPDERISWDDTWLVRFEGFGVIGMADCLPSGAPLTVSLPVISDKEMMFRPEDGSLTRSFEGIVTLKDTMASLLTHLVSANLHLGGSLKFYRTKPNRRIGWDEQWSVRNDRNGVLGFLDRLPIDAPHESLVVQGCKDLERTDLVKASAHNLLPVPKGKSAYQVDPFRSGTAISAGWEIMFESAKDVLDEVVLVNTTTGQRILVRLEALTNKFN